MKTRESFLALIAELQGDHREYLRLMQQNGRAWKRIQEGATDPIDWGALAFTLHSVYGILENYFLRISRFFENSLPRDRWHKSLVEQMTLEIPGVRPALFAEGTSKRLALEMLKFRHWFREVRGDDPDPGKTSEILAATVDFSQRFSREHSDFIAKLHALAEGLK